MFFAGAFFMEYCHVCGAPAEAEAFVEGARVWVCARCLGFGRAVKAVEPAAAVSRVGLARRKEVVVADGFGEIIKRAREAKKLSVGDLAKKIFVNEKELARIEREALRPSEAVARKLERELGIMLLVEE